MYRAIVKLSRGNHARITGPGDLEQNSAVGGGVPHAVAHGGAYGVARADSAVAGWMARPSAQSAVGRATGHTISRVSIVSCTVGQLFSPCSKTTR